MAKVFATRVALSLIISFNWYEYNFGMIALELLPIVKQVNIDIEKCNHKVVHVAIHTDDYQLNVSLFKSFAGYR